MKKLIYFLLLIVSWPTFAARQFDIELIIFKRNVAPETVSESWPEILSPINLDRAIRLNQPTMMSKKRARLLPRSSFHLNQQYNALKRHAGFTPLLHTAWRQGDQGRGSAPVFHLTAGQNFSNDYLPDGTSRSAMAKQAPSEPVIPDENTPIATASNPGFVEKEMAKPSAPLYELDGKLQVYVQHYLFVETELDLKKRGKREVILNSVVEETDNGSNDAVQIGHLQEVAPTVEVEEFLKSYRMDQKRRMRSGETHYLDNPLLGIIIQVRKVAS